MVVASTCRPRYTSSQERILVYSSTPPLDITARVRIPLRTTAMWKSQPELFPSKGALGGHFFNPFTMSQFYNLFGLFLRKIAEVKSVGIYVINLSITKICKFFCFRFLTVHAYLKVQFD